jgi:hypothetical protein
MIDEVQIRLLSDSLDFDALKAKGWSHPKSPSNAQRDTLVKEVEGVDVYIVSRGGSYQIGVLSYDLAEACRVLQGVYHELYR